MNTKSGSNPGDVTENDFAVKMASIDPHLAIGVYRKKNHQFISTIDHLAPQSLSGGSQRILWRQAPYQHFIDDDDVQLGKGDFLLTDEPSGVAVRIEVKAQRNSTGSAAGRTVGAITDLVTAVEQSRGIDKDVRLGVIVTDFDEELVSNTDLSRINRAIQQAGDGVIQKPINRFFDWYAKSLLPQLEEARKHNASSIFKLPSKPGSSERGRIP